MGDVDRVLIVGGGIGGLTLACALDRRGFAVELIERNPTWDVLGAGLSVQPNGMRVLRRLALDDAVLRHGSIIKRWIFADASGEVLCPIYIDSVWGDVGPFVGIARSRLQDALLTGVSSISCRLGLSVAAISDQGERVSVDFTDRTNASYDLVVGADGIHSTVRGLVFGDVRLTFARQISWRSLSPIELEGVPSVQFWLGEECFFGLCSVGEGQTYGFGNVFHDREHDPPEGRLERLRGRFSNFGATVQEYLARLDRDDQIHCSSIAWLEQERWYSGRVVLIGDAAHASSPMMGQGGCMAMEDAWALAESLSAERTLGQALAAYVRRRDPRVKWVQQQSRAVAESFRVDPSSRNEVLRSKGAGLFHDRYAPLTQDD